MPTEGTEFGAGLFGEHVFGAGWDDAVHTKIVVRTSDVYGWPPHHATKVVVKTAYGARRTLVATFTERVPEAAFAEV